MGFKTGDLAGDTRLALARSVAADLEGIFPDMSVAEGPARAREVVQLGAAQRVRRFAPATLGAILAAGFLGVAGGSLMGHAVEAPSKSAARLEVAVAEPAPLPATTPLSTFPETLPSPPAREAAPVAAPRPKVVRVKAKAAETRKARPAACGRSCSRAQVMAADRRLRAAYARAIRAGVARPVLVSYRNEWNGLRRTAADEPNRLVTGYARLTDDLARAADRARRS